MPNALTDSLVDDETPGEPDTDAPEATETAPEPEKPAPITPVGRRAKAREAQEALLAEIKGLRESVSKQGESYAEQLQRVQRENAELRGAFQGYMARPQQAPEQREEKLPDPNDLRRQARKALEAKDFDEYERLTGEAIEASVMHKVAPRFAQQAAQPQGAPPINPLLNMVAGQYVDVVSDRAGLEIAQAHDRILSAQGIPEGPERWKRAFDEGRRYLGSKNGNGTPQFSQKSRGVLAGVPTQRGEAAPSSEGTTRGVRLTAVERQYAKKFKISADEYAQQLAEMHPERIENE